jgi:L-alanine-DL-glutamate epimerase-like enolase superfamily enzyme
VANSHLVAAAGGTLLEYPVFEDDPALDTDDTDDPGMYPFSLAFDVLDDDLDIDDGRLSVPDGPGLGVDMNLDVVKSYPYIEGPWTEFVYDE